MLLPGYPWVPSKNFSKFGIAVWPAIPDIYIYILIYKYFLKKLLYIITKTYLLLFEIKSTKWI